MLSELQRQFSDLDRDLPLHLPRPTEWIWDIRIVTSCRRIAPSQVVGEPDCRLGSLHGHCLPGWRVDDEAYELAKREGVLSRSACIDDRSAYVRFLEPDDQIQALER